MSNERTCAFENNPVIKKRYHQLVIRIADEELVRSIIHDFAVISTYMFYCFRRGLFCSFVASATAMAQVTNINTISGAKLNHKPLWQIVVVGSSNTDLIAYTPKMPKIGETLKVFRHS